MKELEQRWIKQLSLTKGGFLESCRIYSRPLAGSWSPRTDVTPAAINCSQIERIRYPGKFDFKTITIITIITIIEASSTDMNADES